MKNNIFKLITVFIISFSLSSCDKDFLDTFPTDQVAADLATASAENGLIVINGIHRAMYDRFGSNRRGGVGAVMLHNDLMGEDLVETGTNNTWPSHYQWRASTLDNDANVEYSWAFYYHLIGNANVVISGIDNATGEPALKNYVKGQALVYRAFGHYKLVQLFADRYAAGGNNTQLGVPYKLNNEDLLIPRNSVEEVYALINADLDMAITALQDANRNNKSHINQSVARGMKARVNLTQGNWDTAIQNAQLARNGFDLMSQETYAAGFKSDSEGNSEFMWASQITAGDQSRTFTDFGAYVSRNFSGNAVRGNPKAISKVLYDQISATDVRKTLWDPTGDHPDVELTTGHTRHPYTNQKFLVLDNGSSRIDIPLMRAAEMYLIEAEANARKGGSDAQTAQVLFDFASSRDNSYTLSTNTGQALIDEIMIQRRVELWCEGFRFDDLKRLNQDLVRVVGSADTGTHQASFIANADFIPAGDKRWVFLIPRLEIDANPNVEQNPL